MPGELVLLALRHVWKTLEPLNVPVALIGLIFVQKRSIAWSRTTANLTCFAWPRPAI